MKNILNLWCGMWANIPWIIKRWNIYNVDIDNSALNVCKKKYPNCKYILSSAENINFEKSFFDEIYCFDVLEHVNDIRKTMYNLYFMLKQDWFLYVEIPYSKSEKILSNIKKEYFEQIWQKRSFEYDNIKETFERFWFYITKKKKSRWIVHIKLWLQFKLWFNISNQQWWWDKRQKIFDFIFTSLFIRFDKNIFNSYFKYIPLWIFTLPIWYIISLIFPKTIEIHLKKISNYF